MNNKMLALYGFKWNPFAPSVPTETLYLTTRLESFCPAFAYACVSQGKR